MNPIKSFLKLAGVVFLLTMERVVGLPFLFVFLSLVWLDKNQDRPLKLTVLLAAQSLLLAAVYHLSWLGSLVGLAVIYWAVVAGEGIKFKGRGLFKDKKRRILGAVLLTNLVLVWVSGLNLTFFSFIQFVLSYLLVMMWLKVLRKRDPNTVYSF